MITGFSFTNCLRNAVTVKPFDCVLLCSRPRQKRELLFDVSGGVTGRDVSASIQTCSWSFLLCLWAVHYIFTFLWSTSPTCSKTHSWSKNIFTTQISISTCPARMLQAPPWRSCSKWGATHLSEFCGDVALENAATWWSVESSRVGFVLAAFGAGGWTEIGEGNRICLGGGILFQWPDWPEDVRKHQRRVFYISISFSGIIKTVFLQLFDAHCHFGSDTLLV